MGAQSCCPWRQPLGSTLVQASWPASIATCTPGRSCAWHIQTAIRRCPQVHMDRHKPKSTMAVHLSVLDRVRDLATAYLRQAQVLRLQGCCPLPWWALALGIHPFYPPFIQPLKLRAAAAQPAPGCARLECAATRAFLGAFLPRVWCQKHPYARLHSARSCDYMSRNLTAKFSQTVVLCVGLL